MEAGPHARRHPARVLYVTGSGSVAVPAGTSRLGLGLGGSACRMAHWGWIPARE